MNGCGKKSSVTLFKSVFFTYTGDLFLIRKGRCEGIRREMF